MAAQIVDQSAGSDLPEAGRVWARRDYPAPIRAEGRGGNRAEVTAKKLNELPGRGIPDARVLVPAGSYDELAVGGERYCVNVVGMAREDPLRLASTA
jgi:hypothetical protein